MQHEVWNEKAILKCKCRPFKFDNFFFRLRLINQIGWKINKIFFNIVETLYPGIQFLFRLLCISTGVAGDSTKTGHKLAHTTINKHHRRHHLFNKSKSPGDAGPCYRCDKQTKDGSMCWVEWGKRWVLDMQIKLSKVVLRIIFDYKYL